MNRYFKVMLGKGSAYAMEAKDGGYFGADFINGIDLSNRLPENWREFNQEFRPLWLKQNPGKTMIGAGLACGQLWTVIKGIKIGDIVLSPTGRGSGTMMVGEVTGEYEYHPNKHLQHRRKVNWFTTLERDSMTDVLKHAAGGITTVIDLTKHSQELDQLIHHPGVQLTASDDTIEDPSVFALEKHLEDFLIHNWRQTVLGKKYDIYEQDGEIIGQQYPSDTGPIDILAISKDKKEILVIELKKGRLSDTVVGQIQRYMGYVKDELAERGQNVRGLIIGLEDDLSIKRALSVAQNIEYMTYSVSFKLNRAV